MRYKDKEAQGRWIRITYYSGYLLLAAFLVLSLIYYQERMAFLDAAFYLFEMARTGSPAIFHSRFISVFTQWLPLGAIHLSLPLKTVALLYSLSFPLYYALCYALCGVQKDYRMALSLLVYLCLFTSHNFYWHLSELNLGTALLFPFLSFFRQRSGMGTAPLLVMILFLPVLVFSHPLLLFPFGFAWVFFYFFSSRPLSRTWFWTGTGYYLLLLSIKHFFFQGSYESTSFGGLRNIIDLFPRYDRAVSVHRFLINLPRLYYFVPLVYLVLMGYYLTRKRYREGGWLTLALTGFGGMIMISYPEAGTDDFYLENLYMPMAFFLALPLVFHYLPRFRKPGLSGMLVLAIGGAALVRILGLAPVYEDRTDFQKEVLAQFGKGKYILDTEYLPSDRLYMTWASPYEFWFLSTVNQGYSASLLITEDTGPFEYAREQRSALVTTWGSFEYDQLPTRYFSFPDRENTYEILRGKQESSSGSEDQKVE